MQKEGSKETELTVDKQARVATLSSLITEGSDITECSVDIQSSAQPCKIMLRRSVT